jgi:hypothetical protein
MGRRSLIGTGIVIGLLVCSTAVASAKGPAQGVVRGKAIEPARLNQPRTGMIGPLLAPMIESSGFFEQIDGQGSTQPRPSGRLGVRYTVTYRMDVNRTGADRVRQFLFPYAEAGPVVRMPAGQRIWGSSTAGGWHVGDDELGELVRALDLPTAAQVRSRCGASSSTCARIELDIEAARLVIARAG